MESLMGLTSAASKVPKMGRVKEQRSESTMAPLMVHQMAISMAGETTCELAMQMVPREAGLMAAQMAPKMGLM